MKSLVVVGLTALCSFGALAQTTTSRYGLSEEGGRLLDELRLQKSQRALIETPVLRPQTRQRLSGVSDKQMLDAALRDLSVKRTDAQNESIDARIRMHELSKIAETKEGEAAFEGTGWSAEIFRDLSRKETAPLIELHNLNKQFGVDSQNRLMVRPGVLIVNSEPMVSDELAPGKLPSGYKGPPPIWRRGLLFSVLIGTVDADRHSGFCSGTLLAKYWVVTAAHCLRQKGKRLDSNELFVYFPFQGGSLSVTNVMGGTDKGLRKVSVKEVSWLGDKAGISFPETDQALSEMMLAGQDLAMLRLAQSEMDALPVSIEDVRLVSGSAQPPVSMIGYGWTNKGLPPDLSLAIGLLKAPPNGLDDDRDLLISGAPDIAGTAGLCGGDSGGGLFSGKVNGGPGTSPKIFAVVSGLIGSVTSSGVEVCLTHQQGHTSLLTARNRGYFCEKAPAACMQ